MKKSYSMTREVNQFNIQMVCYTETKRWENEKVLWYKTIKKDYHKGKLIIITYLTGKLNKTTLEWEKVDHRCQVTFI